MAFGFSNDSNKNYTVSNKFFKTDCPNSADKQPAYPPEIGEKTNSEINDQDAKGAKSILVDHDNVIEAGYKTECPRESD